MSPHICIVKSCKTEGTHRLPKNETRKGLWLQAIPLKPWLKIGMHSRICSAHFLPTDFTITPLSLLQPAVAPKVIKRTAIPSVFGKKTEFSLPNSNTDWLNVTEVNVTYARYPRIFFEEQSHVSLDTDNFNEDPLKLPNEVDDKYCHQLHDVDDASCVHTSHDLDDASCAHSSHDLHDASYAHTSHDLDDVSCAHTLREVEIFACQSDDGTEEIVAKELEITTQEENKFQNKDFGVDQSIQTEQVHHVCQFSINTYKSNDKAVHFYTGLESFSKLLYVMTTLGPSADKLNYFYGSPPKELDTIECFFITLLILRRHKPFEEIAMDYQITEKQVTNIFITWIRFMSLQWKNLDLWISKEKIRAYMPSDFNDKYPSTRVILDATEFPIKKPKLPLAQQVTFSSYKNRNTVKALIGIAPSGLITYVSPCYGGSVTDRQIIERSSILNKFNYNDEIMVDKGLNVQDIFMPYGVKVNMPSFFKKGNQITPQTLSSNRKVASKRVHVERIIGMLKTYKILTQPMNQTETILSSDIVYVCAMLVNFRSCIVSKDA